MSALSTPGRSRTGDQVAQKTGESGTNADGCEGYGSITPALLTRNAPESCAESAVKVQLAERILARTAEGPSGCWLWSGAVSSRGYGQVRIGGRTFAVHRVIAEQKHGPIGDGQMALHRCDVKRCCRPDHLYVGDARQNNADAIARGRFPFAAQAFQLAKSACRHGHPYDAANTYVRPSGGRGCKRCKRAALSGSRAQKERRMIAESVAAGGCDLNTSRPRTTPASAWGCAS